MNPRLRRVLYRLVLVGVGTGLGLVAVELALLVHPLQPPARPDRGIDRSVFCQYDSVLGYDGVPGLIAEWPSGDAIQLNSSGDRDVEHAFERPGGVLRAVLLGDSFLWGYGVRDVERSSNLLAGYFEDPTGRDRRLETINLAVSGYGTDQEFLKYLLREGRYEHDLVVLGFYSGNDPLENAAAEYWNCPKPRFGARGNRLVLTGVPVRRLEGWPNNRIVPPTGHLYRLRNWSRLVRLLSEREFPLAWLSTDATSQLRLLSKARVFDEVIARPEVLAIDRMAITTAILEALRAHLEARRTPLILMLIPSAELVENPDAADGQDYSQMRRWAEERDVPFVDFLSIASNGQLRSSDLYWTAIDQHWSPLGNELAAQHLARRIAEVLVTTQPGKLGR